MLKQKNIFLLWLFLAIVTLSSCNKADDPVDPIDPVNPTYPVGPQKDVEFTIVNLEFVRFDAMYWWGWGTHSGTHIVNEITFGDTIAVMCKVKTPLWTLYYIRDNPIEPPIVAKITSSETGDVQYVIFILDPWDIGNALVTVLPHRGSEWRHIGFISPVKFEYEYEHDKVYPSLAYLTPDTTRQELQISPNGDILTAEIQYKDQILTKTITVKGE